MPNAHKKPGRGTSAPDPRRKEAFTLFASGMKTSQVANILRISERTVTQWRKADDWATKLQEHEAAYWDELVQRLGETRAAKDAAVFKKLLRVRDTLVDALADGAGKMDADKLAGSLEKVQRLLDQLSPAAEREEGGGPDILVGVRFVAAPKVGADG